MEVDWRLVLFELLNFVVLMLLLSRFLFQPVRKVLGERRLELERRKHELATERAEAEKLHQEYLGKLANAEAEGELLRKRIGEQAQANAERVVQRARRDMELAQQRQGADLEAARRRSLETLRAELLRLAVDGAARVVEDMSDSSIAEAYAREGARRLLGAGDVPPGATVRLWTSGDGDPARIRGAVSQVLRDDCQLDAEVDPELVGGVRLAFRDLEIDSSAGASLRHWLEEAAENQPPLAPASGNGVGAG